jgi:hypothetical protein
MSEAPKKEVTQGDLEQFGALLKEHEIEALVAKHKPQGLSVNFDVDWLDMRTESCCRGFRRCHSRVRNDKSSSVHESGYSLSFLD